MWKYLVIALIGMLVVGLIFSTLGHELARLFERLLQDALTLALYAPVQ